MKKLIGTVIVLSTILGMQSSAPAAEIHLNSEIERIPAKITNIFTCGHWSNSTANGFYRIIYIEYYYDCSLLYVQWMRDFTDKDPTTSVLHTLSISEFNADDHISLTFDKPECIETDTGIKFNIEAVSGHDSSHRRFELQVSQQFGKYTINEKGR